MALIKCKECGKEFSDKAEKCPDCGCPVDYSRENPKTIKCDFCGAENQADAKACSHCGASFAQSSQANTAQTVVSTPPNNRPVKKHSVVWTIVWLIFFFPYGLYRMWRYKHFNKIARIIITIIIAFVFIWNVGSGSSVKTTTTTSTKSDDASKDPVVDDSADAPAEEKDYYSVGESFDNGSLKITVNDASTDFTDYSDEYGINAPADGMKYVMADFTYENIASKGDEYASIYDFDCFADNANCDEAYGLDDNSFVNGNLSPGRNVSFRVYFQVPVNASSIELEYKESFWTDSRVKIKLQ